MAQPVPTASLSHRLARPLTTVVLFVAMWGALIRHVESLAPQDLDASWSQAFAYLLVHGLRLGDQIVFTFGPLGYFTRQAFRASLFFPGLLFEIGLKGGFALVFAGAGLLVTRLWSRLLFTALVIVFVARAVDAPYYLAAALLALAGGALQARPWLLPGALALLAVTALMKFTFLVASVIAVLAIAWSAPSRRMRAITLLGFVSLYLAGWRLCRQRIGDLPLYLRESARIASGYSAAMSYVGRFEVVVVAVLVLVSVFALILACVRRAPARLPIGAALALIACLAFKAGFVTQDIHVLTAFWSLAPLALVLGTSTLLRDERSGKTPRAALLLSVAAVALSLAGAMRAGEQFDRGPRRYGQVWWTGLCKGMHMVTHPTTWLRNFRQQEDRLRQQLALPRIAHEVQGEPVDIWDWEQGVLLLNGFHWQPRPVFHSYMTYTPELMQRNADFLRGDASPRFLIVKLQPFRGCFWPTMADGLALQVVLRRYQLILQERDYLLLRKQDAAAVSIATDAAPATTRTLNLGATLELNAAPATTVYAAFDLRSNVLGSLLALIYQPPPIDLVVTDRDGVETRWRVVPGMIARGMIVSPLIRSSADLARYYRREALPQVRSLRLEVAGRWLPCYQPRMGVRLWTEPR